MNAYTIGGILLIAAGTLLMAWGQRVESRRDSSAVETKLEDMRQYLTEAKENAATDPEKAALDSVEASFEEWAEDFAGRRGSTKIQLEQERLAYLSEEVEASRLVWPVYEEVLFTLRLAVNAYNQRFNGKLLAELPPLPENLYGREGTRAYTGFVKFDKTTAWQIGVLSMGQATKSNLPFLYISLYDTEKEQDVSNEYITISVRPDIDRIRFSFTGSRIPRVNVDEIPLNEYKQGLSSITRRMFEAQVVSME